MNDILNFFVIAEQGKELWTEIKNKYDYQNDDLILLLPMDCDDMNKVAIQYIPHYIGNKYIDHVFIIHRKDMTYLECNMTNAIDIALTEDQMTQLVSLYKLFQFEKNIVAIIPELPFASIGIFRKKGITVEDYVKKTFFEWVRK